MIKLRDHYFIAWLKVVKERDIFISEDGIYVDINKKEYDEISQEYSDTLKPVLKEIRKMVKELASLTANKKV